MTRELRCAFSDNQPGRPPWESNAYTDPRGYFEYSVDLDSVEYPLVGPRIVQTIFRMDERWVVMEPVVEIGPHGVSNPAVIEEWVSSIESDPTLGIRELVRVEPEFRRLTEAGGPTLAARVLRECAEKLRSINPTPDVTYSGAIDERLFARWIERFEDGEWGWDEGVESEPEPSAWPRFDPVRDHGKSLTPLVVGGDRIESLWPPEPTSKVPPIDADRLVNLTLWCLPSALDTRPEGWRHPALVAFVYEGWMVGGTTFRLNTAGAAVGRAVEMGYHLMMPAIIWEKQGNIGFDIAACYDWDLDWWLKLPAEERAKGWTLSEMVWMKRAGSYQEALQAIYRDAGGEMLDVGLDFVETPSGKYKGQPKVQAWCGGHLVGEISQQFRDQCPEWLDMEIGSHLDVKGCIYPESGLEVTSETNTLLLRVEYSRAPCDPVPNEWVDPDNFAKIPMGKRMLVVSMSVNLNEPDVGPFDSA